MNSSRLLLVAACLVVAWVEAVLAALLWPMGEILPPIDGLDTWLAGFVTVGVGALVVSLYRQVARPLAQTLDALLAAAGGRALPASAAHFGRTDEIGDLALVLATLQGEGAERERLNAELAAREQEAERRSEALAQVDQLIDEVLDAIPVPISICDPQGRIAFVNRAWQGFFRVRRGAVLGLPAGDDGTARQDEVWLHGHLFHRSHAVLDSTDGNPGAVVTTFLPQADDPGIRAALHAEIDEGLRKLGARAGALLIAS